MKIQYPEKNRQTALNYRDVFDLSQDALLVTTLAGDIVDVNQTACFLLARSWESIVGCHLSEVVDIDKNVNVPIFIKQQLAIGTANFIFKKLKKNGKRLPLEVQLKKVKLGHSDGVLFICQDISPRKHIEAMLQQKNDYLHMLHETALALMNRRNLDGLLATIINKAGKLVGSEHGLIVMHNEENGLLEAKLAVGFYRQFDWSYINIKRSAIARAFESKSPLLINDYQRWSRRADWHEKFKEIKALVTVPLKIGERAVGAVAMAHMDQHKKFGDNELMILTQFAELASLALDNAMLYTLAQKEISERARAEERLRYCSFHDVVTGIYNRAYFEEMMSTLESKGHSHFGIIVCDVDGLKFVNDSFGHMRGDSLLATAASVIRHSFREEDIVARIGGDEFAVLLPESNAATVKAACGRIRESVELYNQRNPELPLSISVGYAVTENAPVVAGELFKRADNNMYQEKIRRSRSSRSAMKQALVKALEKRDFIDGGHTERMEKMAVGLAARLRLPSRMLEELCLLAQFHDIGKVGIVDSVLFKAGRLDKKELAEIRRHSEIGHRIAQSNPEWRRIGDYILKHHEWWNWRGYPLGLAGSEIPLESRIISIVDAYDAMTNERPYRQRLSPERAMEELKAKSGSQFDPDLVGCFMDVMREA